MVLGLLLRDEEERQLVFDFEALLPDDGDESMEGRNGAVVGVGGATYGTAGPKKDFKRGTVVCRHWLRALCMKGDNCEFLHQYDMSKMPECRWGMECQVPECPFRHVPDEERVECAFYKQGFCSHGSSCRYRHIKLAREECPETADFSLQAKVADEENVKRRKAQPVNEFYKIAICKHWEKMGSCPFGDECHFAHGEKELRPFPKGEKDAKGAGGGRDHNAQGGGPPPRLSGNERGPPPAAGPQLPDDNKLAKYFLVQSASYQNLAHSVHHSAWSVPLEVQNAIKMASETSDDVFLFFTVTSSKHYQGVARVVSSSFANTNGAGEGEDLSRNTIPFEGRGKSSWSGVFGLEWLRICECPWERLAIFENKQLSVLDSANGHEIEAETGHALMRLLFNQPKIQLHYRSVEDEPRLLGGAEELAIRRREAAESVFGGPPAFPPNFNGGGPPSFKVSKPGFVFGCTGQTIDECFGRMLFGLPKDQDQVALKHIMPGTPLFLLNMSDLHVLGIFEALSPPVVNMIPNAFAHGPRGPSPLPVQVRIGVALNGPAINSADPQIQQIIGDRGVRVGPLSIQVTQKLADVFLERCGPFPPMNGPNGPGMQPQQGDPSMGPPPIASSTTGADSSSSGGSGLLEKLVVGIEPDNEFGVSRRIIGPGGSYMKRISVEAGGNAKIRVRGRGSGAKEGTPEEANEPLMVLVSAENERSFQTAVAMTRELLAGIHRDYQMFMAQKQQQSGFGGPPGQFMMGGPGFGQQ